MNIKKQSIKDFYDVVIRYLFLILIALPNLYLFYLILTPLTVYPVYWLLKIAYGAFLLNSNTILIGGSIAIELISACIAGAAYYLLLILNLTTREIPIKKRVLMVICSFATFLVINVLRIFFLSALAFSQTSLFDITHKIFWYSLSTILVLAIWFAEVKIFKIKAIPIYSDVKFLFKKINKK